VVEDSTTLIPPVIGRNIPGVILVNRERIEFYQMNGNVLSRLRRGTLGTGPSDYLPTGTKVIDQSPEQTVPYNNTIQTQVKWTDSTTNTYTIHAYDHTSTNGISTVTSNGIILQNRDITQSSNYINNKDQIVINYGGRVLRKDDYIYHDFTVAYDSLEYDLLGTTSTVSLLPN
jgi:hypothetical protein